MPQKNCPKCKKTDINDIECFSCGIIFAEYKKNKQAGLAKVYGFISSGELEQAKELAEKLAKEFPDSMGDFLLLLSNINRDISIVKRYERAQEYFKQKEYDQVALLLRNIKAFDKFLDEKVISLRKKTEHCINRAHLFNDAVAAYDEGSFANAMTMFGELDGYEDQEAVDGYLRRLDAKKDELLRNAKGCIEQNLFDSALIKFDELHDIFPDMAQKTGEYLSIISQKKKITDSLLAVADTAREEKRFMEAKAIYSYLTWQCPELKPRLLPYIEEIGSQAIINLADCEREQIIDLSSLEVMVNSDGFFESNTTEPLTDNSNGNGQHSHAITSVVINPTPLADIASAPVDLDNEEIADFV